LLLLLAALLAGQPAWPTDYTAVLREVYRNEEANRELWLRYSFDAYVEKETLAKNGRVKRRTTRRVRLVPTEGWVEATLLEVDGREPRAGEVRDYRKRNARARKKAERERAKRGEPEEEDPDEEEADSRRAREAWILNTVRLVEPEFVGKEEHNGRETLRYDFAPREGAEARTLDQKFLHNIEGTMWVDEAERVVVEIAARSTGRVKIKGGLAGLRDLEFRVVNAKVRDQVWFPERLEVRTDLRILLKKKRERVVTTYSDYKRAGVTVLEGPARLPAPPDAPPPPPDTPPPPPSR
jgi:hypothetical protein